MFFAGLAAAKKVTQDNKTVAIKPTIVWTNGGTTPTVRAVSRFSWRYWGGEMPADFDFADEKPGVPPKPFYIAPKGTGFGEITIPIVYFELARRHQGKLYIWGWTTYHDTLANTPLRVSEFCTELGNVTSTKDDITDSSTDVSWEQLICGQGHNCNDAECRDYQSRISAVY